MAYTILVAEDEPQIRALIKDYLTFEGYKVLEAVNGEEAVATFCAVAGIDLVLLDVMMPKQNGYEACESIRAISQVPILFLTALSAPENEIKGFELGADDYIAKPFRYDVLMARVKSALKRQGKRTPLFELNALVLDMEKHSITHEAQLVDLSPKEYDLLVYLVQNVDQALERQQILDAVWGFDFYGDPRTIDSHIKNLRSKLPSISENIKTIRGFGYRLERVNHD